MVVHGPRPPPLADSPGEERSPSAERRPVDGFLATTMVVLCAIWGAQQVAIKLAAGDVVPLMQVTLRSATSAALVALLGLVRGEPLGLAAPTWRPGALAGVLFGVEFLLIAEGLRHTTASHMAVFLYTAPVFTALGLHARVRAERLGHRQWIGIAIAFCGIALAFAGGWLGAAVGVRMLWGDLLGVLAGAAWGATTVVVRASSLAEAPPSRTLFYQLAGGFLVLLVAAVASGQVGEVLLTPVAWASLVFQGVVVSFASYLAWFWLLRRYVVSRVAVFSFLTPLFGVSFGVLALGEPVDPWFGAGAALVICGIVVVSGRGSSPRR
jgi:drug/metabolite transporter (DMT)-like permease